MEKMQYFLAITDLKTSTSDFFILEIRVLSIRKDFAAGPSYGIYSPSLQ